MQNNNRIFNDMLAWQDKLKEMNQAVNRDVSNERPVLREKLREYRAIAKRYPKAANQNEKIAKALLRSEIRKLERTAYPNSIVRAFRRAFRISSAVLTAVTSAARFIAFFNKQRGNEPDLIIQRPVSLLSNQASDKSKAMAAVEKRPMQKKVGQYTKQVNGPPSDIDLMPKLRHSTGKGLRH